jgi:hypothetical protein
MYEEIYDRAEMLKNIITSRTYTLKEHVHCDIKEYHAAIDKHYIVSRSDSRRVYFSCISINCGFKANFFKSDSHFKNTCLHEHNMQEKMLLESSSRDF